MRGRLMDWRSGVGPVALVAWVVMAPTVQAFAPPAVNARVEISAAVAGSSATLEAIERQANARDRVRQQEIAALQARLAEAEARGAAEDDRLQAQLIEAREALVADLASRDRAYAEEIAVFRREVTSIASTADGAAALARFNAGDRVGAIAVLDQLRRARDAARQARADIESAAEARQIATLALDARGKSDPAFDTAAVIIRYEDVVQLDAGEFDDWAQLVKLFIAAGRRSDATEGIERLEALAANDEDRSVAWTFTADLLLSQGDRSGAIALYTRSLGANERLLSMNSSSPDTARVVSNLLDKIGKIHFSEGEIEKAMDHYSRSFNIREHQFSLDPSSVEFASAVSFSLNRVGDVLLSQGDRDGALSQYQRSLEIRERLMAADPASVDRARDVSVSLELIGDMFIELADHNSALSQYQRSLEIRERLLAADQVSVPRTRDVSVSLIKIGDLLLGLGDRDGAVSRFQRNFEIAERLSATDPSSADLARDVFVSCVMMANLTGDRRYGERALSILRDQEARGTLAKGDRPYIAQLEQILAQLDTPEN